MFYKYVKAVGYKLQKSLKSSIENQYSISKLHGPKCPDKYYEREKGKQKQKQRFKLLYKTGVGSFV